MPAFNDPAATARLAEHLYMEFEKSNGSDLDAARALWNGAGRDSERVRKAWTRKASRALEATFPQPERRQRGQAVRVVDVIDAIRRVLPDYAYHTYLDHTGGNCASIRVDLPGGGYVLINDEDVLNYSAGEEQPFSGGLGVSVYRSETDDDPRRYAREFEPTAQDVADVVARIAAHSACPPQAHDRDFGDDTDPQVKAADGKAGCNDCCAPIFYCAKTDTYHHDDPTGEPCFLIPE